MAHGRGKLSDAPVIYCLIQVRFSPILTIQSQIPAIQESLRSLYPRYQQGRLQSFMIGPEGKPEVTPADARWEFASKDNVDGFMLQNGSYVFHTTKYTTFEQFIKKAIDVLTVVGAALNISLIERIGLRYIDAIVPREGELLEEYVVPSIMGFPLNNTKNSKLTLSFTQTNSKTDDGELVAKFFVNRDGAQLPFDLSPCNLTLERQIPNQRITALLDTDHFYVAPIPIEFDVNNIYDRLSSMHEAMSELFWNAISDKAYTTWK